LSLAGPIHREYKTRTVTYVAILKHAKAPDAKKLVERRTSRISTEETL
jgi:hypothetical protein